MGEIAMADKKKTCFIIMPISTPDHMVDKYHDGVAHFEHVLNCLFRPSVEKAGFEPISPKAEGSDLIHAGIIDSIETADLVLCDISCLNPNVFFEFGMRTSLNRPVCLVKDELIVKIPFDTGNLNHHTYKSNLHGWDLESEIETLAKHLKTSAEKCGGKNPLWKWFGMKAPATPDKGEPGVEGKIDALAMQMDALNRRLEKERQIEASLGRRGLSNWGSGASGTMSPGVSGDTGATPSGYSGADIFSPLDRQMAMGMIGHELRNLSPPDGAGFSLIERNAGMNIVPHKILTAQEMDRLNGLCSMVTDNTGIKVSVG